MGGIGVGGLVVVLVVVLLVIVGVVGLVVLLFSVGARQRKEQTSELAAYAAARGFSYRPDDPALVDRFDGDPFGRGSGRTARHVLQGTWGERPVLVFEYRFATGSGDHRHRHVVQVVATALPTGVPRLELVPASTLGTFLDAFGGGEHQVGDPFFDAAYRIFTASPEFAADVLDPAMRAWLMPQHPPFFRLDRADLVVVAVGALTPAGADRALAFADALVDRVPPHVWERAARRLH